MPFLSLKAAIECDGCGTHFVVDMDLGDDLPSGWDLPMLIKDQVRGGHCTHLDKRLDPGFCSVQHDMMLCGRCTRIADAIGDDDEYQPTKAEIESAIEQKLADEVR